MYLNETLKVLNERASLRNYSEREIEPEVMDMLMQTACNSPSGGNIQPFSIIKIQDKDMGVKLGEMCWQPFIGKAPLNLLYCLDLNRNAILAEHDGVPYTANHAFRHFWISFQDTIISAQSVCVAADSMGLGSCYIGTIMEFFEKCIEMFQLPKFVIPVVLISIGYPESKPNQRKKFTQDVIVHDEKYHQYDPSELSAAYANRENGKQIAMNEKNTEMFHAVCQAVHGKEYADEVLEKTKARGFFSPIQNLYGLHYHAAMMPMGNLGFLKILQNQGIDFFEDWRPLDDTVFDFGEDE